MANELAPRAVGGYLARLAALAIDLVLVIASGILLGLLLAPVLSPLGTWTRFLGYGAFVAYFGLFDAFGATVGKRLMRLEVRRADGDRLALLPSLLRAGILFLPFLLSGANTSAAKWNTNLTVVEATAAFAVGGASIFLWLLGGPSRQSLHDLALQTYVVKAGGEGAIALRPTRRRQGGILVVWLALVAAAMSSLDLAKNGRWPEQASLEKADRAVLAMPGVKGTSYFLLSRPGSRTTATIAGRPQAIFNPVQQTLILRVLMAQKPADPGRFERTVARTLVADYPPASRATSVRVLLAYGYDVGIAHHYHSLADRNQPASAWLSNSSAPPPSSTLPQLPANLKDLSVGQLPPNLRNSAGLP